MIELLIDYHLSNIYNPWKKKVVVDAFVRTIKSMGSLAFLSSSEQLFSLELQFLSNRMILLNILDSRQVLAYITV